MKKNIIKIAAVSVSVVILLASFLSLLPKPQKNGITVVLSKNNITFIEVGETAELSAVVIKNGFEVDTSREESKIVWTSSDQGVATVEDGVVTSVGYGSCVIRASSNGGSAFCTVNNPNPNPPLTISDTEVSLDNIGKKTIIYATSDSGDDISSVASWKSSNENIVVCEDGVITAVGYGSCTVTAVYNRKAAVCTVTVKNPTAPIITLSADEAKLGVGESFTLSAVTDNNAGKTITWKSTNSSVATCEDGVINAKANGTCAVIAITEHGYSDVCIVTVGEGNKKNEHANYLEFGFPDIGKDLQCVDKSVGQISASSMVIGYEMKTLLLSDGRLVVEISLICIKTFDMDGIDGTNPALVTASLYRENDTFCDKRIYKQENVVVGDVFTVKCSGFTVQTKTDGTAREFYMTFATVTER